MDIPCVTLRKDFLQAHETGVCHKEAVTDETRLCTGQNTKDELTRITRRSMIGRFKCLLAL